jgi:hypothetical protein
MGASCGPARRHTRATWLPTIGEQRRHPGGRQSGQFKNPGGGSEQPRIRGMDDEQQRRIAKKGGESSTRAQERDEQDQFTGTGCSNGWGTSRESTNQRSRRGRK